MSGDLVRGMDWGQSEKWDDPLRGAITFRTLFSAEVSSTTGLTAGIAEVAPGDVFRCHSHPQPEVYLVLQGQGRVVLGETETPIVQGDTVFIPGNRVHGVTATGGTPLRMFYVLAADAMEDVDYEFNHG